jgi:monoamine oxidase
MSDILPTMGNGVANKIFATFSRPFWGEQLGWLNFVARTEPNRYPVALILPTSESHMIMIFVSANASREISSWPDEVVKADLETFLSDCVQQKVEVEALMMTRWHQDEHSRGSYSFRKVGQNQPICSKLLRRPIEGKLWLVGEHVHPVHTSCVHGAYETGIWAA